MIDTFLFVAGINTLLQTWFGTRLPVVMGASYAYIIPIISISLSRRFNIYVDPHQVGFLHFVIPFFQFSDFCVVLGQTEWILKDNAWKCFVSLELGRMREEKSSFNFFGT